MLYFKSWDKSQSKLLCDIVLKLPGIVRLNENEFFKSNNHIAHTSIERLQTGYNNHSPL